ncbi:MAG: stage II sporulation protein R [Eubacteriales bacterium]
MKNHSISYILVGLALVVLVTGYTLTREQQALADKLVRLHVVANSDTDLDQSVKLQVRDAVLEVTATLEPTELEANLATIQTVANETLSNLEQTDRAVVTLERELFPTRDYDTFTLPAGTYTSLRVTIGEGTGHNWWCVVYPSLCLPATTAELTETAMEAGLTQGEIALITEQEPTYELKFKSLEWLETIQAVLIN